MVLRVDVMERALRARYGEDPVELREQRRVIALTPGGRLLDDALAAELAAEPALTLLCGRYEGFDERIVEHFCTDEISIGRYVLAGGELAAMVVADTVLRKLPGALGHADSARRGVLQRGAGAARRSTRTTRAPPSGAAGRSPRCCSPATTSGSASGAWSRAGLRAASDPRRSCAVGVRYHRAPSATPRLARGSFFAMSTVIDSLERAQLRRVPRFQPGTA